MNLNHRKRARTEDEHNYGRPVITVEREAEQFKMPARFGFEGWFPEGTECDIQWTNSVEGLQGWNFVIPGPGMSADTVSRIMGDQIKGNVGTDSATDGNEVNIFGLDGSTISGLVVNYIVISPPTAVITVAVGEDKLVPAVIDYSGTFPAGSEINVAFTSDAGAGGFQFYTPADSTSQLVADAVAEGIRQNDSITADVGGNGIVRAWPFPETAGDITITDATVVLP